MLYPNLDCSKCKCALSWHLHVCASPALSLSHISKTDAGTYTISAPEARCTASCRYCKHTGCMQHSMPRMLVYLMRRFRELDSASASASCSCDFCMTICRSASKSESTCCRLRSRAAIFCCPSLPSLACSISLDQMPLCGRRGRRGRWDVAGR